MGSLSKRARRALPKPARKPAPVPSAPAMISGDEAIARAEQVSYSPPGMGLAMVLAPAMVLGLIDGARVRPRK